MTADAETRKRIAHIRCHHRDMRSRPCGQCLKGVSMALRTIPASLVRTTARAMLRLNGCDCEPTPVCLADALDLLQEIAPAVRAAAGLEVPDAR